MFPNKRYKDELYSLINIKDNLYKTLVTNDTICRLRGHEWSFCSSNHMGYDILCWLKSKKKQESAIVVYIEKNLSLECRGGLTDIQPEA